MGVFPGFTADQFGAAHNSVNYGIMFIGFAMAGYFGPTIMKNVYYKNGFYTQAVFNRGRFKCGWNHTDGVVSDV